MNLVSNDALVLAAAAETVTLARAAVKAARDAVEESTGVGEVWTSCESGSEVNELVLRRSRRRKRRKRLELLDLAELTGVVEDQSFLSGSVKSGYLSRREEAECCLSLKVFPLIQWTSIFVVSFSFYLKDGLFLFLFFPSDPLNGVETKMLTSGSF